MSTPSIETIDKLPQRPQHERVNPTGKANEERDQEAFKKMLRRRLQQGGQQDGETDETDALIVEIDLNKDSGQSTGHEQESTGEPEKQTALDETAAAGDRDESPAPPAHIDLKA